MNKNNTTMKFLVLCFLVFSTIIQAQNNVTRFRHEDVKPTRHVSAPGGKTILTNLTCPEIKLNGHNNKVWSVIFSPNNKNIASCGDDKTIKIWDIETGDAIKTITFNNDTIMSLAYSPGGRYLATGSVNGVLLLWDLQTEKQIRVFYGHTNKIWSIAFTPNGRYIVTGSADKTIKIWDVKAGTLLNTLTGHDECVFSVAISPDSKKILSGAGNKLKVWAFNSNTLINTIIVDDYELVGGKKVNIYSVAFSLNGKLVSCSGTQAFFGIWDSSGKKIKFTRGNSKWDSGYPFIKFTPDSEYILLPEPSSASIKIRNIEQLKEGYIFSAKSLSGKASFLSADISGDGKYIVGGPYGWGELTVWDISPLNIINSTPQSLPIDIELVENGNVGFVNNQAFEHTQPLQIVPKVWAVVVGINDYSDEINLNGTNDLTFCKMDAKKMYAFFKSPVGGAIPENQIKLLLDPTKSDILNSCETIFRQSQKEDLIVFYFSGHGGVNLFLANDDLLMHSELKDIIYSCKANKKVIIADACHSGSWDKKAENIKKRAISPDEATNLFYQALGNVDEGLAIFMASQANEYSIESPQFGHGVFTYFFIDGLKGKADNDNDRIITIKELYEYVSGKVSAWGAANGQSQHPQIRGKFPANFPIGIRNE